MPTFYQDRVNSLAVSSKRRRETVVENLDDHTGYCKRDKIDIKHDKRKDCNGKTSLNSDVGIQTSRSIKEDVSDDGIRIHFDSKEQTNLTGRRDEEMMGDLPIKHHVMTEDKTPYHEDDYIMVTEKRCNALMTSKSSSLVTAEKGAYI